MSVQVKGSGTIGGLDEGLVVSGIVTSSTQINVGSNIRLGNAGVVTATTFVGNLTGNLTGTATQVSLAAQSSDTDCYPVFSLTATGNQALYTKSNRLSFNSATGALSATSFVGDGSNITGSTIRSNLTYDGTTLKIGGDSGVSGTWNLETYNSGGDGNAIIAGVSGAVLTLQDTVSGETFKLAANGQASLYSQKAGDNMVFYTKPSGGSDTERLRIASDGTVTVGDGNNLAANYDAAMLIDGDDNSRLSIYGSSTGSGTVAFPDGSGSAASKMAGFIKMNHNSTDNGPRLMMGLNNTTMVHLRSPGSNRGQLEIYGSFNESDTTAIEISDGGDARKVYLTNSSGDFNALTRNGSQTKGQLKMFESGVLIHNMKNPDATSTLQTLRTGTYKVTSGSTYTSISPIQSYMQKGDPNNYGCFEEGNCQLEVNGGGNDHYQPVAFVPRGYNLDTTSFGGQWAGEMWIHQTSSQNPTSYGYSGYNTWATMSFKCRWDCAHWNAKPSGFWVEHYINQGRGNIGKIDASDTMSQFVIYLLPGSYKIRWNCVRGMSVHRAVSDGASLTLRDGGSFATYSTLAYSSRNTSFDSEIAPGSASFAHCT